VLGGEGPYGHTRKVKKGGYVVGEGVVAIPHKEDVRFFFLSKGYPRHKAGMVHFKASIVDGKVEVLKLSALTPHANLTRVVPTGVLRNEEFKQRVLSIRKVG
jgi:hypothetical protein